MQLPHPHQAKPPHTAASHLGLPRTPLGPATHAVSLAITAAAPSTPLRIPCAPAASVAGAVVGTAVVVEAVAMAAVAMVGVVAVQVAATVSQVAVAAALVVL